MSEHKRISGTLESAIREDPHSSLRESLDKERQEMNSLYPPPESAPRESDLDKRAALIEKNYQGPGQGFLSELREKAHKNMEARQEELRQRYIGLIEELQLLQRQKDEIEREPIAKADLLALAKKVLLEKRTALLIDEILLPHFKKCQTRRSHILSESSLFFDSFNENPRNLIKLIYFLISDRDIEAVIAKLPKGIGMSQKTKNKKKQ